MLERNTNISRSKHELAVTYGRCGHHVRVTLGGNTNQTADAAFFKAATEDYCDECKRQQAEAARPKRTADEIERDRALWD